MKLLFPLSRVRHLAAGYEASLATKKRDARLTAAIKAVFASYARKGFLTKEEFMTVCAWKTPRTQSRCRSNPREMVREVSALARTTKSERMRIQVWTLLAGVNWPTASVFLHFSFPDQYPILDRRALWSLGFRVPPPYSFEFWERYAQYCRTLARRAGVSMREFDQALWQYSKENQEP